MTNVSLTESEPKYNAIVDAGYSGESGAETNGIRIYNLLGSAIQDAPRECIEWMESHQRITFKIQLHDKSCSVCCSSFRISFIYSEY